MYTDTVIVKILLEFFNLSMNSTVNFDPCSLPVPTVPRCLQLRTVTKGLITYSESLSYTTFRIAGHAFIYAPQPGGSVFGIYKAAVMMQLRFDGTMGFPGGLIDKGEDILTGLNRELKEEIGWDASKQNITWDDYYQTQVDVNKKLVLHFFIHKLKLEEFIDLEKKAILAPDYGTEVFGTIRVPLYTLPNMYSGFPAFLGNNFIGIAKQQLLLGLYHSGIFSEKEIEEAIHCNANKRLASSRV